MTDAHADAPTPQKPSWALEETAEAFCEHGMAMDVHCCNCHSGFLFDLESCVCNFDPPTTTVATSNEMTERRLRFMKLMQGVVNTELADFLADHTYRGEEIARLRNELNWVFRRAAANDAELTALRETSVKTKPDPADAPTRTGRERLRADLQDWLEKNIAFIRSKHPTGESGAEIDAENRVLRYVLAQLEPVEQAASPSSGAGYGELDAEKIRHQATKDSLNECAKKVAEQAAALQGMREQQDRICQWIMEQEDHRDEDNQPNCLQCGPMRSLPSIDAHAENCVVRQIFKLLPESKVDG